MNLKDKIRKKSFWVTLSGAIVIVLQLFGVKIDLPLADQIIGSICAVLIVGGIITGDNASPSENEVEDEIKEDASISPPTDYTPPQSSDNEQNQ